MRGKQRGKSGNGDVAKFEDVLPSEAVIERVDIDLDADMARIRPTVKLGDKVYRVAFITPKMQRKLEALEGDDMERTIQQIMLMVPGVTREALDDVPFVFLMQVQGMVAERMNAAAQDIIAKYLPTMPGLSGAATEPTQQ